MKDLIVIAVYALCLAGVITWVFHDADERKAVRLSAMAP